MGKNEYVVCIPSYKRAEICNTKTLKTLKDNGISKSKIYVYVANKEEYDTYKQELDKNLYNKLTIGIKGLVQVRQFIMNQWPEGKHIVFMDDDITSIDLSMSEMFKGRSLDYFLKTAFEECIKKNAYIWGVYPVFNPYFRKGRAEISEDLTYIVGAFYGIINRPNLKEIKLTITEENGQKEDVERTIKYFIKDGTVLRFNRIGFNTTYYGQEGGLGTFEERLKPMKIASEKLEKEYPEYGRIKVRKNGMTEFVLKKIKAHTPELTGGAKSDIDFTNKKGEEVLVEKIPKTDKLKKLREELLEELATTKFKGLTPNRKRILGENAGSSMTLGCGFILFKGVGNYKTNKEHPKLLKLLTDYGNLIKPEGFEFRTITLNKNMKAKKHKDKLNSGYSFITAVGNFDKGGLYLYDPDGSNQKLYSGEQLKNSIILFNGSNIPHESQEHEGGDRYTIIYYKSKDCEYTIPKITGTGKPKDKKLYEEVKEEVYKKVPKHSLFRSALLQREYKKRGGEYKIQNTPSKMNIKKWFRQNWVSLNDYVRGKDVKCGDSDTKGQYGEYPLCRPKKLADKLGKERIKLMIKEKKSKEPLLTKKVVGTEEFNIKPTLTGTAGTDRFFKQLKKIKFPQESYIDIAKRVAKREGYDPEKLSFANNNDNKLKYEAPDGVKYFGKAGYGDYIIWLFKERNKQVPVGYADKKRNTFRKSHGAMTKKYKLGKFSPNELAINILW